MRSSRCVCVCGRTFVFQAGEQVVAERKEDGQRFSLRPWQYEMIRRFDGHRTFEQSAREVYGIHKGGFTAVGLLNFYRWLYQEDLIWCRCESIFELVDEDRAVRSPIAEQVNAAKEGEKIVRPSFGGVRELVRGMKPEKPWQRQAIGVTAIVLFSLAVIRLTYVAAPIFEPPLNQLYSKVEGFFYEGLRPAAQRESIAKAPQSPPQEVNLAGRAETVVEEMRQPIAAPPAIEKVAPKREAPPQAQAQPKAQPQAQGQQQPQVGTDYLEELRRQMSECRIRRDEFYIQNNEDGYRREVEKMTALAREFGEIEARL